MMSKWYELELAKILRALNKLSKRNSDDHEITLDELKAELSEPRWMPANKQVYKNPNGKDYKQEEGFKCNPNSRQLTLSEVGKEPVQHLVDALEKMSGCPRSGNGFYVAAARTVLKKHKELMG